MTDKRDRQLQATANRVLNKDLANLVLRGTDADVQLPPGDAPVFVSHTVQIPIATYERIQAAARQSVTSPGQLIQQWIDEGLQDLARPPPPT